MELLLGFELEKSVVAVFLVMLILFVRKRLNTRSANCANILLWVVLLFFLLFPYAVVIRKENIPNNFVRRLIELILFFDRLASVISMKLGSILPVGNRLVVTLMIIIYFLVLIVRLKKAVQGSYSITKETRVNTCLGYFNFKRHVEVLLSDAIRTPITYGVFRPKIILPKYIVQDDELLSHVLLHELIHVQQFDMIITHLKNLVACIYWYNIFIWIAAKHIEEDIEIRCDKMVVNKIGDTPRNRKRYCLSMIKILEKKYNDSGLVLNLNPIKERILVIQNWKKSKKGILASLLIVLLFTPAFVTVKFGQAEIIASAISETKTLNMGNLVTEITEDNYDKLPITNPNFHQPSSANLKKNVTLAGLDNLNYKFSMLPRTEVLHNGFIVRLSDLQSSGDIDFRIVVYEDNEVAYRGIFTSETTLMVKAYSNRSYMVVITNDSVKPLTFDVLITSYVR